MFAPEKNQNNNSLSMEAACCSQAGLLRTRKVSVWSFNSLGLWQAQRSLRARVPAACSSLTGSLAPSPILCWCLPAPTRGRCERLATSGSAPGFRKLTLAPPFPCTRALPSGSRAWKRSDSLPGPYLHQAQSRQCLPDCQGAQCEAFEPTKRCGLRHQDRAKGRPSAWEANMASSRENTFLG